MRFLCDMGVSMAVVEWLRRRGEDATHLREEGLQRLPNGEIFRKALADRRVVVTFDLDFGEIAAMSKGGVASVLVVRLRNTRAEHVIERLDAILKRAAEPLAAGAVVVVEESRIRIRHFPLGGLP